MSLLTPECFVAAASPTFHESETNELVKGPGQAAQLASSPAGRGDEAGGPRWTPKEVPASRGEESSLAGWAKELYGPLLQTALSYLRNRDAAEEVVQETWMAAIRQVSGFKGKGSFRGWIFVILLNCTKQRLKKRLRRKELLGAALRDGRIETDTVTAAMAYDEPPSSHVTPERLLLSAESGRVLHAALATLPAKQRAVLHLRHVEGYTSQEICSSMGLSPGAVRALNYRARLRLRRLMAPYLNGSV